MDTSIHAYMLSTLHNSNMRARVLKARLKEAELQNKKELLLIMITQAR